ncbi:hypothetical protein ZWY2020_057207 [Hordeum vulgare]|nr:hypothetical protein ZWY2020_057207 [Hordeum vulgare]
MTALLPGRFGLEIAYKGGWIKVQPAKLLGYQLRLQLEVVTNGYLKAVEHRCHQLCRAPLSLASFIVPDDLRAVGPRRSSSAGQPATPPHPNRQAKFKQAQRCQSGFLNQSDH